MHAQRRVAAGASYWCGSALGKSLHACIASRIVGAVNDIDWPSYLSALSTNQSEIARAAGVSTATVSRWSSRSARPLAPQVIAVARAYDQSPVFALVAAGYLTQEEVEQEVRLTPGMSLAEFSELEIAQELVRRIEAGEATEVSAAPLDVDHPAWANVSGRLDDFVVVPESLDALHDIVLRDANGSTVALIEAKDTPAVRAVLAEVRAALEDYPHAAKKTAIEVPEDEHTV